MRFKRFNWDLKEKIFTGTITFDPDTVFGVYECRYTIKFSHDMKRITSGKREYWYEKLKTVIKEFSFGSNYILYECN